MAVCVAYLQRYCKAPTAKHLRMMNRLLGYVHRKIKGLTYEKLPTPLSLIMVGDSAFQAPSCEDEAADPLVLRGYILALAHETKGSTTGSKFKIHLLEWSSGKQRHVCRGVWSSELRNQCDMVESGTIISAFIEEVRRGPATAEMLKKMIENGENTIPCDAYTDSYSLYSYLASVHLKYPAEKGTFFHLAYLREKLASWWLRSYSWIDTRDMCVDGLTKGRLDRTALHLLMDGYWHLSHERQTHSDAAIESMKPAQQQQPQQQ